MTENFKFQKKIKLICLILIFLGVISLIFGYIFYSENHHKRFWLNLLINNLYFFGITIGALFFLSLQYVSNTGWSVVIKRIPEAIGSFLPVSGVLMTLLFLGGLHTLYHWTHNPKDAIILQKVSYLNESFFWIRFVTFFILWIICWFLLRQFSIKEDKSKPNVKNYIIMRRNSIIFVVIFAITITLASFDWIMSLDPHWFSTMFGVYIFSGVFCKGIAAIILISYLLQRAGYLKHVNENHFQDLGKYLFGFSTFWCYIWFFQYMLIWYANMPEETRWYVNQLDSGLFFINPIINWLIPFFGLISRSAKRNFKILIPITTISFLGYWLELFLMTGPIISKKNDIGLFEFGVYLGFLGLFSFVIGNFLTKASLIPKNHPLLQESLSHHQ